MGFYHFLIFNEFLKVGPKIRRTQKGVVLLVNLLTKLLLAQLMAVFNVIAKQSVL